MTVADDRCSQLLGTIACLALMAPWLPTVRAAQTEGEPSGTSQDPAAVVARVNGQPILRAEVLYQVRRMLSPQAGDAQPPPATEAAVLEYLVRRTLVLQYLSRTRAGASDQDIDFQVEQHRRRLAQRGITLEDHLRQQGLDMQQWRSQLAWQLGWPRFLQRHLDEEKLIQHFQSHRWDYDGTQLRVAHILLPAGTKGDRSSDRDALKPALSRAEEIRARIQAGEISFADAARAYSTAPTASQGGDLGFIARYQPMPEVFNRAAFALQPGQVSPPVVSPLGVQLIQCLEVKAGGLQWQDVRDQLRRDVTRMVFDRLARDERRRGRVMLAPH